MYSFFTCRNPIAIFANFHASVKLIYPPPWVCQLSTHLYTLCMTMQYTPLRIRPIAACFTLL